MSPEDKAKIKGMLEEMTEHIDDVEICMLMYNGQSVWAGSQFELVGWIKFIEKIIIGGLLTLASPHKSNIITSDTMQ